MWCMADDAKMYCLHFASSTTNKIVGIIAIVILKMEILLQINVLIVEKIFNSHLHLTKLSFDFDHRLPLRNFFYFVSIGFFHPSFFFSHLY